MYTLKINLMSLIFTVLMVTSLIGQTLSVEQIFLPVDSEKLTLQPNEQRIVNYNQNVESVLSIKIVTSPTVEYLSVAEKLIFKDFSSIFHSFNLEKFKEQEGPQYLWYEKMEKGMGSITLIHINNHITGTVHINGDLYKIIPVNKNLNIIPLIDQSSFTPEDPIDDKYNSENSSELSNTLSKIKQYIKEWPSLWMAILSFIKFRKGMLTGGWSWNLNASGFFAFEACRAFKSTQPQYDRFTQSPNSMKEALCT